jgi:hypothetical protein
VQPERKMTISYGRGKSPRFFRAPTRVSLKALVAALARRNAGLQARPALRRLRLAWTAVARAAMIAQSVFAQPQASTSTPEGPTSMPVPAEAALARAVNAPVNPLIVRYRNGELTIEADNATLNDILRAVSKEIGAVVDVPSVATDPVLRHLGPGPVAGVLNALLKPSRFNYAIRASSSHGRAPVLVILSARPAPAALARQIQNPVPAQASVGVVPAAISTADGPTKPAGPGAPQQAQSPDRPGNRWHRGRHSSGGGHRGTAAPGDARYA